jgi:peptidyl-dipeptidase Dcp
MQNLTLSSAPFFRRTLRGTCVAALLFAIGCMIVPLCGAAKPASPSPSPSKKVTTATSNPLLTESTLPYQMPPFDKIKDEHFQPALEQGIAEEEKEAEAIAKQTEKPTFENTIVALEKMGRLLDRARRIFSNFTGANTNPVLQQIEKEMAPKFSAHSDAIRLNGPLFARIEALYNDREKSGLDAESKWLLERYYKDFVRAGAKLSEPDKTKLKALNAELATLQTTFEQNVLKEKNAASIVVNDRAELAGLSDNEIAAAAAAAKADGKEGKFVIRLLNTTGQPSLASLQNRPLREKIMQTSLARNSHGGEWDNKEVVSRTAKLRAERATLLGYANHAAYQLEDQTAKDVPTVNKLLSDLAPAAVANAKREGADMQAIIDQEKGGFQLAACDWDFYSEKVRKARYAFDESQLKPYFELNHVITDGVFFAAGKLYGLTFKERKDLPVYLPDVRIWEVFDADGKPLALFIGDYYARPSKRGGAWMNQYVPQSALLGTKPVVANHLNIPKPPAGEPTLLAYDEVRTAFHEFGHALHGMFSNVKYPRFSGTSVPRDFVEYPSQVNEMWATWPEILKNYAKHYKTGEPMPAQLLDKMLAADKFNQGSRRPNISPPPCSTSHGINSKPSRFQPTRWLSKPRRLRKREWSTRRCRRVIARLTSPMRSRAVIPPATIPTSGVKCSTPTAWNGSSSMAA